MRIEEEIDLTKIDDDCPVEAFEAAKRRINDKASPEAIQALITIALDDEKSHWSRSAAIYVLGFVDHCAVAESDLWIIARDPDQDAQVREYAEEALYYFAQHRRANDSSNTRSVTYADQTFNEWRAEQVGLPFSIPILEAA